MRKSTARSFKFNYPTFSSSKSYVERSVYYWWYEHLRRNTDYLRCCANNGSGKLASLYKDFGDVRDGNFKQWWMENNRGAYLFAEQRSDVITELKTAEEFDNDKTVIAFSLTHSKKVLRMQFNRWLKNNHTTVRGRKQTSDIKSTALYKVHRYFDINALRTALNCYDAKLANDKLSADDKLKVWELAEKQRLRVFKASEDYSPNQQHNILSTLFGRNVSNATKRIEAVAKGTFPIL